MSRKIFKRLLIVCITAFIMAALAVVLCANYLLSYKPTVGVGDVSQAQIRGGHSQREHKARRHDAERQHTVRDCMAAVRDCFFKFDGSDTRQLLSFHHFGSGSRMQASIAPRAGSTRLCSGRLRTEFHFIFVNFYTLQRLLVR